MLKHPYVTILIGNYFVEVVQVNPAAPPPPGVLTNAPSDGEENHLGPILLRNWMVLPVDTPGNSC